MRLQLAAALSIAGMCLMAAPLSAQQKAAACTDSTSSALAGTKPCAKHGGVDAPETKELPKDVVKEVPPGATPTSAPAPLPGVIFDDNPVGAIAKCRDGKYSHATEQKGSCRGHSGVAEWL